VYIEVREQAFCYLDIVMGQGGLPVGSSGRALLLLSGGIDSPVAGFMTAKRGVSIEAVHFQSPPYTSEAGKQKVLDLAKLVSAYAGPVRVHVVPFTEIQMDIYKSCPHEELVIIMRRFMMRIAEKIARNIGAVALITGESIGQVASQTLESMTATGAVVNMPILRPLIGMDKEDIVRIAREIGTFETSILPYEDCCTVFTPKHPKTKPHIEDILEIEKSVNLEELESEAVMNCERLAITHE
jgi:thiamine biosynthesis protein ThiI